VWTVLEDRIPLSSRIKLEQFRKAMQDEWANIPSYLLTNHGGTEPKRLGTVIDTKGDNTKY